MGLVGIHEQDTDVDLAYCCRRLMGCKLWENEDGKPWRKSVKQMSYDLLLVSQFTLYGTISTKNLAPDYKNAMKSESAKLLYDQFLEMLRQSHDKIYDGAFGKMMDVQLVNDGPVTIIIESRQVEGNENDC